jgi:hypothetical protein
MLLKAMGVSEYQERRRRAVSENMPRAAFVTSDIMIFIWNESFANASYMKRVRQLGKKGRGRDPPPLLCQKI